jgi:Cu+-exporting ATPase
VAASAEPKPVEAVRSTPAPAHARPGAESRPPSAAPARARRRPDPGLERAWRARALVCLAIGSVLTASMVVPLDLGLWAPALLVAATFVQVWGAGAFYRGAWAALRRGRATLDTLVVLGAGSAYTYSAAVTLWPGPAAAWGLGAGLSFAPSTLLVGVALLGRWLEARVGRHEVADRVSAVLAPAVLALSLLVLARWLLPGGQVPVRGLQAALAVLLAGCPAALGLAAPLAMMAGRRRAAELGVEVADAGALERARRIRTVVFDRTGTLTRGRPQVTAIRALGAWDERGLMRLAAATEAAARDWVGAAVLRRTERWKMTRPPASEFTATPGRGVQARVEGHEVVLGSLAHLSELEIPPADLQRLHDDAASRGTTPIAVAVDGRPAGLLEVTDPLRPEAGEVVGALKALGLEVWMITGDVPAAASAVAARAGVERSAGAVPAEQRADRVRALRSSGGQVAVVGDGVDDEAALAEADLGVVVRSSPGATAEADVALVREDLRGLVATVAVARRTSRRIRQGVGWAIGPSLLLLGAGAVLPSAALPLTPALVVVALAVSSVSVAANALRR